MGTSDVSGGTEQATDPHAILDELYDIDKKEPEKVNTDGVNYGNGADYENDLEMTDSLEDIQTIEVDGQLTKVENYKLSNGNKISFWLYVPQGATTSMPVIVYWHGDGENGKGLDYVYSHTTICKNLQKGKIGVNAIVVVPNLTTNYAGDDTLALLDDLANGKFKDSSGQTISVDKKRMGIIGFSRGTEQLLKYAKRTSTNQFKVVVFMSSFWAESAHQKFANAKKVYAIAGGSEIENVRTKTKQVADIINKAGGHATYQEISGKKHGDMQGSVFGDSKILQLVAGDL